MNTDSSDRGRAHEIDDSDDYRQRNNKDRSWIAPTILAAGTFIASLGAAWTAFEAGKEATAAKTVSESTGKRVDGRMEEMLALARSAAAAKATLDEKAAQRGREADEAIAVSKPTKSADALTAAAAQVVLDRAAEKAKKIVDDAAIEAERLLARERKPKGQQP